MSDDVGQFKVMKEVSTERDSHLPRSQRIQAGGPVMFETLALVNV